MRVHRDLTKHHIRSCMFDLDFTVTLLNSRATKDTALALLSSSAVTMSAMYAPFSRLQPNMVAISQVIQHWCGLYGRGKDWYGIRV